MKIFNKIILYLNVLVAIFTIFSYLSPYINPAKFWIFSFFGLAFPYLILLNFVFFIYWLFNKKRYSLLSLVIIFIGYQNINDFIVFNKSKPGEENKSISIMSYNVNQGYFLDKNKIKFNILSRFIDNQKADILLLQEKNTKRINKELQDLTNYPYRNSIKGKGAAIFSRFPIVSKGEINFNSTTNSCLWADIAIDSDTLRIYSVHFMSNQISRPAEAIVNDMESDGKLESKNIKAILSKYKRYVQVRAEQVLKVLANISKSPYPVIIGGDFNDPPSSFTYHKFNEKFKDAFKETGNGLGITYAGVIPMLRIDYLFFSKDIVINDFETIKVKYSDHFPIKAGFSIH
ncbi:MAG TPA: hypothetical protein ENK91_12350 [Bacteroidetes bacterium]|nr:hypothetical protein [Bacteroidota bacterium]